MDSDSSDANCTPNHNDVCVAHLAFVWDRWAFLRNFVLRT